MAKTKLTVFYAWQSDRPSDINRRFIRIALDDAARRMSADPIVGAEVVIDADTEGVVGTPPVTETILGKIVEADVFAPDLTFVARTEGGKLVPNPNVMIEYGHALKALTFRAMMPIMNVHFGPPGELPFDMGHVRHPTQYDAPPGLSDGERRKRRERLSQDLEAILRLMVKDILARSRNDTPFVPLAAVRPPSFFFQPHDVLASFGHPGEQEHRFKRDRAIHVRLFPSFADQPQIGRVKANAAVPRLKPPQHLINSLVSENEWGPISVQPSGTDGITSFTQLVETGELWGVSEQPFPDATTIGAIAAEVGYVEALENYRMVCERDLGLRPPLTLELGATGIKGHSLAVPDPTSTSAGRRAGPIRRDSISRQYQLDGYGAEEWTAALREFLIDLYDLAAVDRSTVLTDRLVEANRLPPR